AVVLPLLLPTCNRAIQSGRVLRRCGRTGRGDARDDVAAAAGERERGRDDGEGKGGVTVHDLPVRRSCQPDGNVTSVRRQLSGTNGRPMRSTTPTVRPSTSFTYAPTRRGGSESLYHANLTAALPTRSCRPL